MSHPLFPAFRDHVGEVFQLGTLELRLEAVVPFEDGATEGFSLQFAAPVSPSLGQGIRVLTHPRHGNLELFLVPIQDHRPGRVTYEAIFNRLKTEADLEGGA